MTLMGVTVASTQVAVLEVCQAHRVCPPLKQGVFPLPLHRLPQGLAFRILPSQQLKGSGVLVNQAWLAPAVLWGVG